MNDDEQEEQARTACVSAGLDPDFWAIVGWDERGVIREPNWKMFLDDESIE
jgi:hypothetical protein